MFNHPFTVYAVRFTDALFPSLISLYMSVFVLVFVFFFLEDDEVPLIQGFSDDEPLVTA